MKARLIIMILSALLALDAIPQVDNQRIIIISDTHLLAPGLVTQGSAISRADAGETKMMAQSDAIMGDFIDSIITVGPELVLITGDLTNNGERVSHERMAWYLDKLAEHGIQSLVLPRVHEQVLPPAPVAGGQGRLPFQGKLQIGPQHPDPFRLRF